MKTTTKKKKNKKKRNLWLNWKALERVYEDHDRKSRESVAKNQRVFDALLATFSNAEHVPEHLRVRSDFSNVPAKERPPATPASEDAEKAVVLKNLVRDWSEEGKEEREKSHHVLVRHLRDVVFKEQLSKIGCMKERCESGGRGAPSRFGSRRRIGTTRVRIRESRIRNRRERIFLLHVVWCLFLIELLLGEAPV